MEARAVVANGVPFDWALFSARRKPGCVGGCPSSDARGLHRLPLVKRGTMDPDVALCDGDRLLSTKHGGPRARRPRGPGLDRVRRRRNRGPVRCGAGDEQINLTDPAAWISLLHAVDQEICRDPSAGETTGIAIAVSRTDSESAPEASTRQRPFQARVVHRRRTRHPRRWNRWPFRSRRNR